MERPVLAFVFVVLFIIYRGTAEECVQIGKTCSCKTSSGMVVDLNALPEEISATDAATGNEYFFSPCKEVSVQGCTQLLAVKVAVCQVTHGGGLPSSYYDAGNQGTQVFKGDPLINNLTVTYTAKTFLTRTSQMKLVCSSKTKLEFEKEEPRLSGNYFFKLNTPIACPASPEAEGLSVGSILVILFFVFFIAYWIGGFIFMKFARRSEGLETIPNYEFWKELPSLIRDGVAFSCRRCTGGSTYEKI